MGSLGRALALSSAVVHKHAEQSGEQQCADFSLPLICFALYKKVCVNSYGAPGQINGELAAVEVVTFSRSYSTVRDGNNMEQNVCVREKDRG